MTHTSTAQRSAHCVTVSVCLRRAQPCLTFRWFQESHSAALRAPPSLACPAAAVEPSVDESPLADHWSWDGLIFLRVLLRVSLLYFLLMVPITSPRKGGLATQTAFPSSAPQIIVNVDIRAERQGLRFHSPLFLVLLCSFPSMTLGSSETRSTSLAQRAWMARKSTLQASSESSRLPRWTRCDRAQRSMLTCGLRQVGLLVSLWGPTRELFQQHDSVRSCHHFCLCAVLSACWSASRLPGFGQQLESDI